jgi:hypothetical protein
MENLLNLCWLLLAVAALVRWRCQAARGGHGRPLVALLFVLALMFPVISASDDLHPAAQAMEDSSKRTQRAWTRINGLAARVTCGHPPAILPALPVVAPFADATELLLPVDARRRQAGAISCKLWRAPPVLI